MDMLDQALDGGGPDKVDDSAGSEDQVQLTQDDGGDDQTAGLSVSQGTLTLDPSVQYQFRADTAQGQVTYRVVQVAQDPGEAPAQVVTTAAFPPGTPIAQAVIQSPFSNGGSPTPDAMAGTETRFTYVPTVTAGGDANAEVATATLGQVTTAGGEWNEQDIPDSHDEYPGQFYVMMSPQDVLQGQRNIAPRTHTITPRIEGARSSRDERRRATHNEVERRRRDKINEWIVQLSKLVPECTAQQQKVSGSKGGILAKACEYITELRTANARMAESLKETERLSVDVELLRQQCEELKQENSILRAQMQQHGIVPPDSITGATS